MTDKTANQVTKSEFTDVIDDVNWWMNDWKQTMNRSFPGS
jgi:hypothetical protein